MASARVAQAFERDFQRAARFGQPDLVAVGQTRPFEFAQDARHVQHGGRHCMHLGAWQQIARGGVDAGNGTIAGQHDAAVPHGFDDLAAGISGGVAQARPQDDPAQQCGADRKRGRCEIAADRRRPALQIRQMRHQRQQLSDDKRQPHMRARRHVKA